MCACVHGCMRAAGEGLGHVLTVVEGVRVCEGVDYSGHCMSAFCICAHCACVPMDLVSTWQCTHAHMWHHCVQIRTPVAVTPMFSVRLSDPEYMVASLVLPPT